MKAMIFAAGVGSRLKPLTDKTPKALIPVKGKPMLLWVAEKLIRAGVNQIVVNVHHHAYEMVTFINKLNYPGVRFIISDESDELLDTGGGLVNAKHYLAGDQPFIVHNVDVFSDVNLTDMLAFHRKKQALATLAVSKRTTSRYFLWNENRLAGWKNVKTGESLTIPGNEDNSLQELAFSGIHIIEPRFFSFVDRSGPFSITKTYLELAQKQRIVAYQHDPARWADIGTPEKLKRAEGLIEAGR